MIVAGERVLVQGRAGGVGGYAIPLGATLGAEVTATSVNKVDYVKGLGAHRVVDISSEDLDTEGGVFDVVVDTVGGQTLDRSFSAAAKGRSARHAAGATRSGQGRGVRRQRDVLHRHRRQR